MLRSDGSCEVVKQYVVSSGWVIVNQGYESHIWA
jgi:hypothetical protein